MRINGTEYADATATLNGEPITLVWIDYEERLTPEEVFAAGDTPIGRTRGRYKNQVRFPPDVVPLITEGGNLVIKASGLELVFPLLRRRGSYFISDPIRRAHVGAEEVPEDQPKKFPIIIGNLEDPKSWAPFYSATERPVDNPLVVVAVVDLILRECLRGERVEVTKLHALKIRLSHLVESAYYAEPPANGSGPKRIIITLSPEAAARLSDEAEMDRFKKYVESMCAADADVVSLGTVTVE